MEVSLWLFRKINSFPKKQRFVLGQQIQNTSLEILKEIIRGNNEKDAAEKLRHLKEINTQLEILRSLLQLSCELKFMNAKSLGFIVSQIDEVGRMLGGWMKSCLPHPPLTSPERGMTKSPLGRGLGVG